MVNGWVDAAKRRVDQLFEAAQRADVTYTEYLRALAEDLLRQRYRAATAPSKNTLRLEIVDAVSDMVEAARRQVDYQVLRDKKRAARATVNATRDRAYAQIFHGLPTAPITELRQIIHSHIARPGSKNRSLATPNKGDENLG